MCLERRVFLTAGAQGPICFFLFFGIGIGVWRGKVLLTEGRKERFAFFFFLGLELGLGFSNWKGAGG